MLHCNFLFSRYLVIFSIVAFGTSAISATPYTLRCSELFAARAQTASIIDFPTPINKANSRSGTNILFALALEDLSVNTPRFPILDPSFLSEGEIRRFEKALDKAHDVLMALQRDHENFRNQIRSMEDLLKQTKVLVDSPSYQVAKRAIRFKVRPRVEVTQRKGVLNSEANANLLALLSEVAAFSSERRGKRTQANYDDEIEVDHLEQQFDSTQNRKESQKLAVALEKINLVLKQILSEHSVRWLNPRELKLPRTSIHLSLIQSDYFNFAMKQLARSRDIEQQLLAHKIQASLQDIQQLLEYIEMGGLALARPISLNEIALQLPKELSSAVNSNMSAALTRARALQFYINKKGTTRVEDCIEFKYIREQLMAKLPLIQARHQDLHFYQSEIHQELVTRLQDILRKLGGAE